MDMFLPLFVFVFEIARQCIKRHKHYEQLDYYHTERHYASIYSTVCNEPLHEAWHIANYKV